MKEQLRAGLSSLPVPKNDYEIVVPEDENEKSDSKATNQLAIEDQADVDARALAAIQAQSKLMQFKSIYQSMFIYLLILICVCICLDFNLRKFRENHSSINIR